MFHYVNMASSHMSEHTLQMTFLVKEDVHRTIRGNLLMILQLKQWNNVRVEKTFSACTFCFPISDHVMLLEGIVSFKCRLMHVQIYA